jgi:CRISPR-associated protein Csb1
MKAISELLATSESRVLIEARLKPIQGSRFQPTGFPDLGAALFESTQGQTLLVESAQSMANRLEQTTWDATAKDLVSSLKGLSYVRVNTERGEYLTSTITEAHRLNSPYILEAEDQTFFKELKEKTDLFSKGVIDRAKLARVVASYDFNSLIHGVFLAKSELAGGRLRIERALSAFIEATGVRVAASGGVKNDPVNPSGEAKEGFGNVPFQRDEYTAESIVAYFNLDLGQLRAYGLGETATALLTALALYKVRAFLEGSLRLRTACDLDVIEVQVRRPEGFKLPSKAEFELGLPALVAGTSNLFGGKNGVTTVTFAEEK